MTVEPPLTCMEATFTHSDLTDCGCGIGVKVINNCDADLTRFGDIECPYADCSPMLVGESYHMALPPEPADGRQAWTFTVAEEGASTEHQVRVIADVTFADAGGCSIAPRGNGSPGSAFLVFALALAGWRRVVGKVDR